MNDPSVDSIRDASRRVVRELGFMKPTLAGTDLPPSSVHALIEIGRVGRLTSVELSERLGLDKSSVSRLVGKLEAAGELMKEASTGDGRQKPLGLTPKGKTTLAAIDSFAEGQVRAALDRMPLPSRGALRDGLASYADALAATRMGAATIEGRDLPITGGYRPGLVGEVTEMHARTYSRIAGFGAPFEGKVAAGLAEFVTRLDRPVNRIWTAEEAGRIAGSVAIDGEHLGSGIAHLRWFIVDEAWRGAGLGRRLLREALSFCDRQGFAETHLWTFRGLNAARSLYERHGFQLAQEERGTQWGAEVVEQRFVRLRDATG